MTMVSVLVEAPDGVTKRITCVDVALTDCEDIVSERFVSGAASTFVAGKIVTTTSAKMTVRVTDLKKTKLLAENWVIQNYTNYYLYL